MPVLTDAQILRLPDLPLRPHPYTILPLPNAIDQWLLANNVDTVNNVFNHSLNVGDIPSDHVLCTLQLSAVKVSRL